MLPKELAPGSVKFCRFKRGHFRVILRIDTGDLGVNGLLYASSNILLYKILICVRCYYIDNLKPFLLMYSIFE